MVLFEEEEKEKMKQQKAGIPIAIPSLYHLSLLKLGNILMQ